MRDFTMVAPHVWRSPNFKHLKSDDAKYLFMYLLTNPHQNSAGVYALPAGYACSDLEWQLDRYYTALALLVDGGLIRIDEATEEVLIEKWFKHATPKNPKHMQGTRKLVCQVQSPELRRVAQEALEKAWEEKQSPQSKSESRRTPLWETEHMKRAQTAPR